MIISPKKYKKEFDYSYASGVNTTIELLKYHPEQALRVFLKDTGKQAEGVNSIAQLCRENNVRTEIADDLVGKLVAGNDTYAIGVFKKFEMNLEERENHIVLVNPSDMGNVGTIIRTCIAFDVKNIAVIRPGVDIFDPKVIRASTGSFFQVNIQYFESFEAYTTKFSNNLYPFMLGGSNFLGDFKFQKPFSLVFGNEAHGLNESFRKVGTTVTIKHAKTIDSLNLSISAALALWESSK